jgi:hypothetical protein
VNLFKRIEVIILLVLAAGGAIWVLSNSGSPDEEAGWDSAVSSGPANDDVGGPKKLVMRPPQVRLLTDAGREVAPFFLPFDPVPEIPAGSTQDVRLRYWLEKVDLQGGLKLVIGDERIEVKSAAAFDLEKLKNKEPRTFASSDWSP